VLESIYGGVYMYIESEQVELKREYTRDIIKEIIAFLNTKGGHIYIGVEDNGDVLGIDDIDKVMNQLSGVIHDSIRPDAKVFIFIEILEQDVICINVKEGSVKPYYIQGKGLRPEGVYVRLGSASVPSSEAGIKQMLIAATNVSFELMPCSNQELIFSTAKKVFSENQLTFSASDYRKLNIVDENNRYTNIGMIISDQCEHSIKVAVFGEEDEFEFIDRREFKGSVFSVLKDTLQYLDLNNHLHSEIIEYQRIEQNDYNKEVIREGLLNAIIHRDYSFSGSILISIYRNRMEITSLGGLVYGLSFNDIGAGISQSRNAGLASIFYRLKYIEAYGTGIRKIRREFKEFELSELIEVTDNTFKLILWNKNMPKRKGAYEEKEVREEIGSYLVVNVEEMEILRLLEEKPTITRVDVQKQLEIGQTKAGLLLTQLLQKAILVREGKGKKTVYRIRKS
jgi:ATP-dependent DNA helicase RecG